MASVALTISAISKSFMISKCHTLRRGLDGIRVRGQPLTVVPAVMKPVQSMPPSKTHVKRFDSPASGCESCMPVDQSELLNSSLPNEPKPLETLKPPAPSTTQSPGETLCPRLVR
ncbi:hypothetical protein Tco_1334209 [Tanacetum coccineum]